MAQPIYIYGLLDTRTDHIRYVGQSVSPVLRARAHTTQALFENRLGNNLNSKAQWIVELGSEDLKPELVILEEVFDGPDTANDCEAQWIMRLLEEGHPLTNTRLPEDLREDRLALNAARERGREMFSGAGVHGEAIRNLRIKQRLTQQDLSNEAGISLGQLNRIERGRIHSPRFRTIEALAAVLGTDADRLMELPDTP